MGMQFLIKIILSALIIASASEAAKRFTVASAILVSLPLVSILTLIWVYNETGSVEKIIELSSGIFWAVLPSLLFFIMLPLFLKAGWKFTGAILLSAVITAAAYAVYAFIIGKFGVKV